MAYLTKTKGAQPGYVYIMINERDAQFLAGWFTAMLTDEHDDLPRQVIDLVNDLETAFVLSE